MRRLASLLAVLVVALLAGCGGDSASSPLDEGLSYLPKNAPFVVSIDTNTKDSQYQSLSRIADKFPFGGQLKQSLESRLRETGKVSFNSDIKPILGNPFVVGGTDARSITDDSDATNNFIGALQAKDKDKLESLVKKQGAKQTGEKNGAKLYKDEDGSPFAIRDDVLLVAGNQRLLDSALERRDGSDHMSEDDFNKGIEGLPKDALLRVYADLGGLIRSDPNSKDALRIKWVNTLTTLGATMQATDDAVNVDFKLKNKPGLSEADLPVASGEQAPGVVERAGEIGFALRNPSQLVKFVEAAGQTVNPSDYGQYLAAKRQIQQRYGVNVDTDVIGQLTGDSATTASVAGKSTSRIELKDPAGFKRTLKKIAPAIPDLVSSGGGRAKLTEPKGGDGLYRLSAANGKQIVFGVVGKAFVAGNEAAGAKRFAGEPATDVGNAKGAAVLKADAEQVVNAALLRLGPRLGVGALGSGLFTKPLGELNGSVSSSTSGMTGRVSLGVD